MNIVLRTFGFIALVFSAATLSAVPRDEHRPSIDFDTQVIPILTRHGCNAGSCHGAAIGRGGFKLSLLGSDAAADHEAIARELEGRRVNLHAPDRSLLLRKPSEQTGHEGGHVLPEDSPGFLRLQRWIQQGARRLKDRSLVKFEVAPNQQRFGSPGESATLSATASFDDGTTEDVSQWTVFTADDPDAVEIDRAAGRLVVHRRGVHLVIARYLDRVLPIRLVVPLRDQSVSGVPDRGNDIDDFVNKQLDQLNLPASPNSDDSTFLRRVTLDLTGRLPTPEQLNRFIADESADKRSRIIKELLSQDAFAQYWALKWANVLGIDSKALQPEGARAYQRWLTERIQHDEPMNETARLMLTAVGDSYVQGAANFSRTGSSPGELAEHVTQVFMGVRLRCANCHDHPLDHWKQDDYHGLAAIFAKVKRGRVVTVSNRGEVTHPVTGQAAVPRIPGQRYLDRDSDGREAFAQWLTDGRSDYLAKVTVNRLWQQLMGRGLVEPVDDMRVTNPATHPELLRWLADDLVAHGFRLKHTIGLICNSAAYGRDWRTIPGNEADASFYSHAIVRPLEAEVVADAIADVTGVSMEFAEAGRAVTLTDNRVKSVSLDVLGRCDRSNGCESSGTASASLARTLHMINGPLINRRIQSPDGRLHQLLASDLDDKEVLDELYRWILSRPKAPVTAYWKGQLDSLKQASVAARREFFEDVMWGLLTSDAFVMNH